MGRGTYEGGCEGVWGEGHMRVGVRVCGRGTYESGCVYMGVTGARSCEEKVI